MTDQLRPHIGIDGYNLALPSGTGVATYGRTLAEVVRRAGYPIDLLFGINMPRKVCPEMRETLFFGQLGNRGVHRITWKRKVRRATVLPFAQEMIDIPVEGRVLAREVGQRLPVFDRLFNRSEIFDVCARHYRRYGRFMTLRMPSPPAIMHWTYPLPIRLEGAHNIYTLHDLVPLRLPFLSLEDKRYYDDVVRACVAQSAHIVTVSDTSRTDIIEMLGADPAKITNAYQSSEWPAARDPAALQDRLERVLGLKKNGYLLFFGAIEPKKNVGRLVEAYLESGVDMPLIMVGPEGWHSEHELRLLRDARETGLAGAQRIRRIEYLPRALLADVVRGARAVVFPSLYEGFGLPALEAMAAGVPVLASNTGALPEVVGDASVSVDPYDVDDIVRALRALATDDALCARLAAASVAQAERFSMGRFQANVNHIYQSLLLP